jgi:hypothetical protein
MLRPNLPILILLAGTIVAFDGVAADDLEPLPDIPDSALPDQGGDNVEPEVTIVRRGKEVVEEYRVNNRLYMVKVKPAIGPSYYMVDTDGDGNMDVRRSDLDRDMKVPQWVLFSW